MTRSRSLAAAAAFMLAGAAILPSAANAGSFSLSGLFGGGHANAEGVETASAKTGGDHDSDGRDSKSDSDHGHGHDSGDDGGHGDGGGSDGGDGDGGGDGDD